jgi:predicted membrane metal-binding protein
MLAGGPIVAVIASDHKPHRPGLLGRPPMFDFRDLFQWDRFITPTIIKTFYWLVIALAVLFGMSGVFSGLATMAVSPFGGFILVLSSLASVLVGIVLSRIVAEFVLIVFRINEHLGAIRDQQGFR